MLAYLSISLPMLHLDLPMLDWPLETKFVLAALGAMLAGVSAAWDSATRLLRAVLVCGGLLSLPAVELPDNEALDTIASAGAGGLVAGFVADDLAARARAFAEADGVAAADAEGAGGSKGLAPEAAELGYQHSTSCDEENVSMSSQDGAVLAASEVSGDDWAAAVQQALWCPLLPHLMPVHVLSAPPPFHSLPRY
jgi:hypothetical protein